MADKEFDNTNRGALFRNNRKTTDKHPDYTGQINVNGVDFWISAWSKQSAKGPLLSLSVTPKDANGVKDEFLSPTPVKDGESESAKKIGGFDDMDDNIPF